MPNWVPSVINLVVGSTLYIITSLEEEASHKEPNQTYISAAFLSSYS